MLAKLIYHCVNQFTNSKLKIGKTIVQKLLFLSLSPEYKTYYYKPYYYGPYSGEVQAIVNSLINASYFSYDRKSNLVIKNPSDVSFSEEEKSVVQRIDTTINFLKDNKLTSSKEISNLSKINLICAGNDTKHIPTIKKKAALLGWEELAKTSKSKIENYIILNDEFNFIMNN